MPMLEDPDMVHILVDSIESSSNAQACKFYMHAIAMHSCPAAIKNPCTDHILEKAVVSTVQIPLPIPFNTI